MNNIFYYAGDDSERRFDEWIREKVKKNGTKADMALYIQNQEILSLLRAMRDMSGMKLELTSG